MTLLFIVVAFLLGAFAGKAVAKRIRSQAQHVDYRERWHEAVSLLESEGKLTDEQVTRLLGGKVPAVKPDVITLRSMATWDRRDIEVARAEKGLPPADDLAGMATWDKKAVLEARAKAELRRVKGESSE